MTPTEAEVVRAELAALAARVEQAERRAKHAEAERDHLRALLTRCRTSLTEAFNDPALGDEDVTPWRPSNRGLSRVAAPSMRYHQ